MTYGVVESGFSRPSLEELLSQLEGIFVGAFGSDFSLQPGTPQAQLIGEIAGMFDVAWQSGEDLYNANRPSTSSGVPLAELGGFIGIVRREDTRSKVLATVIGPAFQPVLTSYTFRTTSGDLFRPVFDTNTGVGGVVLIKMECLEFGPIEVGVSELTEIVTSGTGLTSVDNTFGTDGFEGQVGSYKESDESFRRRYAASTEAQAQNILESMYAALLALDGVTRLRVYVNATAGTVAGRPAHSYETVIEGGGDADIAAAMWKNHPAGITLFGSTTVVHVDSQGQDQDIGFTRPTAVPITVAITTSTGAGFPSTGADDIKAAVVAFGTAHFGIGDDVNIARLYTPVNETPGHVVTALTINAGTADVTIDEDEVPEFTIANVTVNGA